MRRLLLVLLLLTLVARPASASWAHVQTNGTQTDASGSTGAHTITTNLTAGNTVFCFIGWTAASVVIDTFASSPSNTWNTFSPTGAACTSNICTDGNFGIAAYYAENVASGSTTVTATFHDATPTFKHVACTEISGLATSSSKDASIGATQGAPGTGSNGATTGNPGNTAGNNEMAIAAILFRNAGGNVTAGTSPNTFTERYEFTDTFYEFQIETAPIATSGSAGTATATLSADAVTTSLVGTFKEPAGGATAARPCAAGLRLLGVGCE